MAKPKPAPAPVREPVRPSTPQRRRPGRPAPARPRRKPAPPSRPSPKRTAPRPQSPPPSEPVPRQPRKMPAPSRPVGSPVPQNDLGRLGKLLFRRALRNSPFGKAMDIADILYPGWWRSNMPNPDLQAESRRSLDRDLWFSFPYGGSVCTDTPDWYPGARFIYDTVFSHEYTGHHTWDASNCKTWPLPAGQRAPGYHPQQRYIAAYSMARYWNGAPNSDTLPYFGVSVPGTEPIPENLPFRVVETPIGAPRPDEALGLVAPRLMPVPVVWEDPLPSIVPMLKPLLSPSGFNAPVSYKIIPARDSISPDLHQVPRANSDNPFPGTITNPNPVSPPKPTRPPKGTQERKKRWFGMGALGIAKKIMRGTTEGCDAVDAVWKALPGKRKWVPGQPQGCAEKMQALWAHFDEVDIPQALVNLVQMHYEDKLWGKYFKASDKAFGGLGIKGWKGDQPIMEGMGYGFEWSKDMDPVTFESLFKDYILNGKDS